MKTNVILNGDSLEHLKEMPNESINCVMTSPPYWALRDYGIEGQLGLEPTFDEYINKLCDIFDEVKRVLRKDGTCWVNLGDTYGGTGAGQEKNMDAKGKQTAGQYELSAKARDLKSRTTKDLSKSLIMIPFRFAIEMVNRGWILRNTIIWHKPNCMPSSVKDRFTVDFEYLFFFVKNKTYWFETQYEPVLEESIARSKRGISLSDERSPYFKQLGKLKTMERFVNPLGRNKRTVWRISPKPFPEAHFAVYPEEICETPIKAGCQVGGIVLDPFFGAGTTGIVALKQSKQFIGIELNKEYIKIAEKRLLPYLEQEKLAI